jgi:O-antigen/teichoic acid export membrane protein
MSKSGISRDAGIVGAGAFISSISTYVVLIVAARTLGVEGYGNFSAFWGAFFFIAGLLGAFDLEASRQAARRTGNQLNVEKSLVQVGFAFAFLFSLFWIAVSFISFDFDVWVTLFGILGICLVVPLGLVRGTLIGFGKTKNYSKVIAGEGIVRLLLAILAMVAGLNEFGIFVVITVLGFVIWIPWAKLMTNKSVTINGSESTRNVGALLIAGLGSALLISGLPWIVSLNETLTASDVGILMTAILVARVPILAFSVVQSLLIPYFVKTESNEFQNRKPTKYFLYFLIAVATSLLLSFSFGPSLIQIVFGSEYLVSSRNIALMMASSWLLVIHMTLVSWLISRGAHSRAAISWLLGAAIGSGLIIFWATSTEEIVEAISLASLVCLILSSIFTKIQSFKNSIS